MKTIISSLLGVVALSSHLGAALVFGPFPGNQIVPDNDPNGLLLTQSISGSGLLSILDLNVGLQLSGGYNGDLHVTLSHGSGYTVLLNRVGATSSDPYGYTDSGFSSTFRLDDQAANGDVHRYRMKLFGNDSTPLAGALGAAWAPDGRTTDPYFVLDTDVRQASLASFNGLPVDGSWALHIADLAPGGESRLVNWSLEITATAVPEPATSATWVCGTLGALGIGALIRRQRHRKP